MKFGQPCDTDIINAARFFSSAFSNLEDCNMIISAGPWFMGHNGLCLQQWAPNFNPMKDTTFNFPIWVCLPGLLLEFWSEKFFMCIANSFGCYGAIDKVTEFKKWLLYARICVFVQKSLAFPTQISLSSKYGVWVQ
ncbi:hypothetical protein SUGI_1037350 [Cryptomeria japonica]|nr:hypothetical protein SUGI_1037350 [Cryptomeria japonica]